MRPVSYVIHHPIINKDAFWFKYLEFRYKEADLTFHTKYAAAVSVIICLLFLPSAAADEIDNNTYTHLIRQSCLHTSFLNPACVLCNLQKCNFYQEYRGLICSL